MFSGAGFAYPENVMLIYKPQAVAQNRMAGPDNVVW
jgi:hypothetical protein